MSSKCKVTTKAFTLCTVLMRPTILLAPHIVYLLPQLLPTHVAGQQILPKEIAPSSHLITSPLKAGIESRTLDMKPGPITNYTTWPFSSELRLLSLVSMILTEKYPPITIYCFVHRGQSMDKWGHNSPYYVYKELVYV